MKNNAKSLSASFYGRVFIILILLAILIVAAWPLAQASVPKITEIKQGATTSMALDENGRLWCWGSNFNAECGVEPVSGDDSTYYVLTPTLIKGINNVIDAGEGSHWFVVALNGDDGTVWTWGDNTHYTLGREAGDPPYLVPEQVPGLTGVKKVTTGDDFCTVLLENGTVWSWGRNQIAQLGDGTVYTYPIDDRMGRTTPGMVVNLNGIRDISSGNRNVIAITGDGELWIWGAGSVCLMGEYGKIHRGPLIANSRVSTPIHIENLHSVKSVAVGLYSAVALKEDGTVWTWGSNGFGELGSGKFDDSYDPVSVKGLSGIVQVSAGTAHVLALGRDGGVWGWGRNQCGQVGDGTTTDRESPVKIDLPKIVSISAKGENSMALDENGNVWIWGTNGCGQLGNGQYDYTGYRAVPGIVTFPDVSDETPTGSDPTSTPPPTPETPTPTATTITPEPTATATAQTPAPTATSATPGFGFMAGLSILMVACLTYRMARGSKK